MWRSSPVSSDLVEDRHALVDFALADDQRRQDAQHVVAGGQAQEALGPQFRDEIAGGQRLLAADAEQ